NEYEQIDIQSIIKLNKIEESLGIDPESYLHILNDNSCLSALNYIGEIRNLLIEDERKLLKILKSNTDSPTLDDLRVLIELSNTIEKFKQESKYLIDLSKLSLFNKFHGHQLDKLEEFLIRYDQLKYPVFGFLFTKSKAREIDLEFSRKFNCKSAIDLHKKLNDLKIINNLLNEINQLLIKSYNHSRYLNYAFQLIVQKYKHNNIKYKDIITKIELAKQFIELNEEIAINIGIDSKDIQSFISEVSNNNINLSDFIKYVKEYKIIYNHFSKIPNINYAGQMNELQSLHTTTLANTIDERVINFYQN
ncbi:MAG: hypothetical protein GTO02_12235, partial [Candidatus Dadabacteria bacterium]|nr:hypothetical protein [Candidatus Dadabacteria bacterium]